jgi:riboflavin synthase
MFTGIISSMGVIESAEQKGDLRVKIACDFRPDTLKIGESIATSGACITLLTKGILPTGKSYFTADISAETVKCTTPGMWEKGTRVNLERSLKLGDTLDGHFVSGHVDGIATVISIKDIGDSHELEIEVPSEFSRFMAEKGSITLDGVSLTVNVVKGNRFSVNIIPHTWNVTTLGTRKTGDKLNFEIDMLARYVERMLAK